MPPRHTGFFAVRLEGLWGRGGCKPGHGLELEVPRVVRRPGLGAVVEEENRGADHGNGIEGEGDDPAEDGLPAEPIEGLCEELADFGARVR